jgi:ribose 5-phosphate isomerase B
MIIALGSDHGAFELKNIIVEHLQQNGIKTIDCGTNSAESSDYSDYAEKVCALVNSGESTQGILLCGTGIGMSMAANKIAGIRCALCGDVYSAKATRSHNDANVLSFGARVVGTGLALEIVDAYLGTPFSGESRHAKRIAKVMKLETNKNLQ